MESLRGMERNQCSSKTPKKRQKTITESYFNDEKYNKDFEGEANKIEISQ